MNKKSLRSSLLLGMLLLPMYAGAQSIKIQGTVVAESDDEPLPGVTVSIDGTNIATVTDMDGHFTIDAKQKGKLKFSYIGFKTTLKAFSTSGDMAIKLADDSNMLDEVVAIGYGSLKKSDLTGAVAVVKADNLKKTPAASVDQALQGRAAGVTVNANSGQPGAGATVRIRGIGTVNDSNPIYVVDGVICSDISFLSPSDIESTEILKDASSTAIYGSRGANGVILITTKKGEKGHAQVSFDMYYGVQNRWKKLDLMSKNDFVNTYLAINAPKSERNYYEKKGFNEWLQRYKFGADTHFAVAQTEKYANGIDYSAIDTDWQDEVFVSHAAIQNYHASIDGGTDKSNYSFSTSWFSQDGTIIGSDYDRLTLRANTSFQVKPWLKVGENISFVYGKGRNAMNNSSSAGASVISAALAMAPWDPTTYPAGAVNSKGTDMSGMYAAPSNFKNAVNPYSMVYYSHPEDIRKRWVGDIYLELTPFKGFSYRTDFSYDETSVKSRSYKDAHDTSVKDYLDQNWLSRSLSSESTFSWENIVNYNNKWGDHSLNLMAGQTLEEYNYYYIGGSGSNILNPDKKNWYLNQTTMLKTEAGDNVSRTRRLSFLGRIHYVFKDRYLATINFRADGSNKFPENTWGYFPSIALAWKANEEKFLRNVKWLDYLKVRAGWGQIGNDKIGNDSFNQTLYATGPTFVGYPLGADGTIQPGATVLTWVNQGGKWERTETLNFGLDGVIANGLFSAGIDFYIRNTKDMLIWKKGPAWIGNRYDAQANIGEVRNTGLEITLGHANHIGKFNYSVDANISYVKNELTKLNGGDPIYGDRVVSKEGLPLFTFWGYKYQGVYKTDEEAEAHLPGYTKAGSVNPFHAGDAIFADLNGDGIIDDNDKTNLGNSFPKLSYGLNLTCDYQGFDLNLFFQGVTGNKIYNALRERLEGNGTESALSKDMTNVWTSDNIEGTIPTPAGNSENMANSSRFIESGSYLRLKNVQIGYNFQKNLISKIGLSKLRIYAQMSNVFTITKYNGYDPEVGSGVDYGNYPQARTLLFGMNLAF
jgi:TonB-dependent starch-binding outer membrane protein SusC